MAVPQAETGAIYGTSFIVVNSLLIALTGLAPVKNGGHLEFNAGMYFLGLIVVIAELVLSVFDF